MKTIIKSIKMCLLTIALFMAVNTVFPEKIAVVDTTVCAVEDYSDCGCTVHDVICEIPSEIGSDDYIYASFLTDDLGYAPGTNLTLTVRYTADDWEIIDIN